MRRPLFLFFFPTQKVVFSRVLCSKSLLQNVKNSAWGFGECRHSYSRWRHATHSGQFGIFNPFLSVQSQQYGTRCAEYKCVVFSIGKGLRRSRSKCKTQSFNLSFGVCDSPAASKYGNRWIDLFFFFFLHDSTNRIYGNVENFVSCQDGWTIFQECHERLQKFKKNNVTFIFQDKPATLVCLSVTPL